MHDTSYGDVFDMMGQSTSNGHFNAFQKERLGWLSSGVSPPLTTVLSQPGTLQLSIGSYETARDATPRALKIQNSSACSTTSQWYYVEARQTASGVIVHQATNGSGDSSYLLDMTPATSSWSDAGLTAGQTFIDPVQGVTISPVSVGSSGATVNVSFPPSACTHTAPSVTLTPLGTVWTAAGVTTNYNASITNTDTCACACATSTFDISATVPTGWSASGMRTGSIAPGASTSTSVSITVPSSASAAFYNVAVNAANSVAPPVSASAAGTIAISSSLSVSASTNAATYSRPRGKNQTVYAAITTNVTNGGNAMPGATVTVQVKDPAGVTTTLSGLTGNAGTATLNYPIRATSAVGSYTVTSSASMGSISGAATTSFSVN